MKVFDKIQSVYFGHFYFYRHKTTQKKNDLCLLSHCDLSIKHICLGTNMADSNRRKGRGHLGKKKKKKQE